MQLPYTRMELADPPKKKPQEKENILMVKLPNSSTFKQTEIHLHAQRCNPAYREPLVNRRK